MRKYLIILISLFSFGLADAQKYTIKGYLKDASNGETLIGASIYVKERETGTASNPYGFYSLTLPQDTYTFVVSYVGYQTKEVKLQLNKDLDRDFELEPKVEEIEEVVIEGDREEVMSNVKSTEMSVAKVEMKTMKKMPAFLGEVDVIRSIQMLPGVSSVGEGASGFNVRGGAIDHNLILLDEAPVYNSSHVFGFFSVFNPDAIKEVKLYKGGIPAPYGGRLASILDVRMKEGNSKRFAGSGGVGTIFSRLTLEAPIIKDKWSFLVAGRRSYIDLLLRPFGDLGGINFQENQLYFYDLSLKTNYKINPANQLFFSSYLGRDVFGFQDIFSFNYGNITSSVRWNKVFGEKLFMNLTGFFSDYDYNFIINQEPNSFDWQAHVINYSIKPSFTYFLNEKNTLTFGGQSLLYNIKPGTFRPTADSAFANDIIIDDRWGWENALYVQNEQDISARWSLQYGLRLSQFSYIGALNRGETRVYEFEEPQGNNKSRALTNVDTVSSGELIKNYWNPEPRVNATYNLNERSSIKASYMRTAQYIQLMSNTTASLPFDIWLPATNTIAPQIADQIALGYFRNFGLGNDYETSAEVYYKDMQNQIEYVDGADLLLNEQVEGELIPGQGRAYGLELYAKDNKGLLTGWVSYTLSRTERKTSGINNNEWYPTRFDQTHNFSAVAIYELNKKWTLSANFTYISGTPKTIPNMKLYYDGLPVPHRPGNQRNNYRLPAYHRLDLGATMKLVKKENIPDDIESEKWYKRFLYNSELAFSIYNAYQPLRLALLGESHPASRNAFDIYNNTVVEDDDTFYDPNNAYRNTFERLAIFGAMVPAVTYNFEF